MEVYMPGIPKASRSDGDRAAQAEFTDRATETAAHFIGIAGERADELDFSQASLVIVDEILQQVHEGRYVLGAVQASGAAAYICEVARRNYGGHYDVGKVDEPVALVSSGPDFEVCLCGMSCVQRRVANGPDDSVVAFFDEYVRCLAARESAVLR
jgi:hypothetical protein